MPQVDMHDNPMTPELQAQIAALWTASKAIMSALIPAEDGSEDEPDMVNHDDTLNINTLSFLFKHLLFEHVSVDKGVVQTPRGQMAEDMALAICISAGLAPHACCLPHLLGRFEGIANSAIRATQEVVQAAGSRGAVH